LNIRRL